MIRRRQARVRFQRSWAGPSSAWSLHGIQPDQRRRTAGLRIAGQALADGGAAPACIAARAHDRIVGGRLAQRDAPLADLHAYGADARIQREIASPETNGRLAHLGAVEEQTELRVVERRALGVERAADGVEARATAHPEGLELLDPRHHRASPRHAASRG